MKRGIQTLILLSFLFGLSNCKEKATDVLYDKSYLEEIREARKEILSFMTIHSVPGASVTVVKNGEIIYSDAFGLASKDLEVPAKRETKFRVGNISEIFTNLIYQKLVEEGTLHPDSSIQHYYPEFPEKSEKLVLNHLVQQTSGIRRMKPIEEQKLYLNYSLERGIKMIKDDPLLSPPGIFQTESNFNYNLLGYIMEKATKKQFHDLLKEYVTDTLQLNNTQIDNPLKTIKNRSNFYDRNFIAQLINATSLDLRFRAPSDGILSTSEDLAKLGIAIFYSDYLTPDTKENLFEPKFLINDIPMQMTNGWMLLKDKQESNIYGRTGNVIGGSAGILIYPNENLIITYASNVTSPMDNNPVYNIAKHFIPTNEEKEEEDTKE